MFVPKCVRGSEGMRVRKILIPTAAQRSWRLVSISPDQTAEARLSPTETKGSRLSKPGLPSDARRPTRLRANFKINNLVGHYSGAAARVSL
jgi:hypothetical protein